ncbi:thioredoxin family protein [Gemmatimonadota bacterium]
MDEPILDFEALEAMVDPAMVEAIEGPLGKLTKEVEVLLFIAPGCSACPHQVRTVAALALASENVSVEIVDVMQEPEFAGQYEIRSVPTTVVDDELIVVGVKHPVHMAELLLAREGPEGELALFAGLVETGRIVDAADRLLYGPEPAAAFQAFLELWSKSTLSDRMGLTLVVEEALGQDPEGLDPLVPLLIAGLQGDGPLPKDDARRGDTASLLGQIGHLDARPLLEILSRDPNPEVAEAAADAQEELDQAQADA